MKRFAAVLIILSVMICGAACKSGAGIVERPLSADAVCITPEVQVRDFFVGDMIIDFNLPGYEVEAAYPEGAVWHLPKTASESVDLDFNDSVRFECGEATECVTAFSPDADDPIYPVRHIQEDGFIVRIILRKDGRITGYAVAAGWGNNGAYSFKNRQIIKAVELLGKDGKPLELSEAQVNELIDKTIDECILKTKLFEI